MATPPDPDELVRDDAQEVSFYDLFLAALPLPMVAGVLAGRLTAFPVNVALFIGASITVLVAGWGLFMHYPS